MVPPCEDGRHPAEILAVVEELKKEEVKQGGPCKARKLKISRVLLTDLIGSLIDGGFFKNPRDLASIKAAVAEIYLRCESQLLRGLTPQYIIVRRFREMFGLQKVQSQRPRNRFA